MVLFFCALIATFAAAHVLSGLDFDTLLPWSYLLLDLSLACLHAMFRFVLDSHNAVGQQRLLTPCPLLSVCRPRMATGPATAASPPSLT